MKLTKSDLREKVMIILYQIEFFKKKKIDFDVEQIIKENVEIENEFVNKMVYGVLDKENILIEVINKHMTDWTIDRLGMTDSSILKLSTYELIYMDTPNIVCINEAIELAKKYSDDKIVKMINAVLDSILNEEEINE